jgi:hypothetical protein
VTWRQTLLLVIVLAILLGFALGGVVANWPWTFGRNDSQR